MPIRLAQVGALAYDPAHVRLPSDYVGAQHLFPNQDGLRPPTGAYSVGVRVFECPSSGQIGDPMTLRNQMNLC